MTGRQQTAPCRRCGKTARLRQDDTIGPHADRQGQPCPGAGHPAAWDPPCLPTCQLVGTIGHQHVQGQPHRSTVVCDSPAHQQQAHVWVREATGQDGVFTPFPQRARNPR